jgi:pantoate--beta-alanine ligase
MRAVLAAEPGVEADYVSVAELETLAELDRVDELALASLAARVGPVRLIDNLILSPGSSAAASDHR